MKPCLNGKMEAGTVSQKKGKAALDLIDRLTEKYE